MKHLFETFLCVGCGMLCACQQPKLSVEELAERVTNHSLNDRIEFRLDSMDSTIDFFEIKADTHRHKVVLRANSELSLATGFHWFLKYDAGVHLSWNNPTQSLPDSLPLPQKTVRRETPLKMRYYLNYCTHSYSMAFWDWERWQQEIDWMALHGVNMPLSITGVECVWRNLLKRIGYTSDQINDFVAGPAYMAWWQMNNLEGWGGPNPDQWYEQREALQKKIVARMRALGIEPVFPGYSGMVPSNIGEMLGYQICDAGRWCGFRRPAFLSPEDPHFEEFAQMYYEELERLYGRAKYYSMDPFHEGGNTERVDLGRAAQAIHRAMKKANPEARWVIQAWQENPRTQLLEAIPQGDLVVLDLYSEKRPQWGDPQSVWCREQGFSKHDWLYCMLLNFGGNVGMHGRMEQVIKGFYQAKNHPNGRELCGVGATPEGIENNPVMYELLYELPWRKQAFDAPQWLNGYLEARYGGALPKEVSEAWSLLEKSVYAAPRNYRGEGTVESVFCARPNFHLESTSTWGCSELYYDADMTRKAAELMLKVADQFRGENNFEYDLVDVLRQSFADRGNVVLRRLSEAYDRHRIEEFKRLKEEFLQLILAQDRLLSLRKEFSLTTWIHAARNLGNTTEQKDLYEWNAAAQISVWGDRRAANQGGLHDYSHREWAGCLQQLYHKRWSLFLDRAEKALEQNTSIEMPDFYEVEYTWASQPKPEVEMPSEECVDLAKMLYEQVFGGLD